MNLKVDLFQETAKVMRFDTVRLFFWGYVKSQKYKNNLQSIPYVNKRDAKPGPLSDFIFRI